MASKRADYAGLGDARCDVQITRPKMFRHNLSSAVLSISELWVSVELAPPMHDSLDQSREQSIDL